MSEWAVASAQRFADEGRLEEWIHAYLAAGVWKNAGLSDGLKKAPRWWRVPVLLPVAQMIRTCGPEETMAYRVPEASWHQRTDTISQTVQDIAHLPPVILEWVKGKLFLRDGNHRCGAAVKQEWEKLWALVWFNKEADWRDAVF